MKTIAFIFSNFNNALDYSHPQEPNPGVGGTQFLIWELSCNLGYRDNNINVIVFTCGSANFPDFINRVEVASIIDAVNESIKLDIDYLVLRGPNISPDILDSCYRCGIKIVIWSHNLESFLSVKKCSKYNNIVKYICVSEGQLDRLVDTKLYPKCTYIYNGIDFKCYKPKDIEREEKLALCYIGNLYPHSGIEEVIIAWKKLRGKYPKLKLIVIGGNSLYNAKVFNGYYSKKSLEQLDALIKECTYNSDGALNCDVTFTGVLGGREKLNAMKQATIGIANITKSGETFGLAAVEFQALGIPVVSLKKYGVRETVQDGVTGILVDNYNEMVGAIDTLLSDKEKRNAFAKKGIYFVRRNFDIDIICQEWEHLIHNDFTDSKRNIMIERFKYDSKMKYYFGYWLNNRFGFRVIPGVFWDYIGYCIHRVFEKLNLT